MPWQVELIRVEDTKVEAMCKKGWCFTIMPFEMLRSKMLMDIKTIDIVEAGADVAVVYTPCYYKVFMMMVLMMMLL